MRKSISCMTGFQSPRSGSHPSQFGKDTASLQREVPGFICLPALSSEGDVGGSCCELVLRLAFLGQLLRNQNLLCSVQKKESGLVNNFNPQKE